MLEILGVDYRPRVLRRTFSPGGCSAGHCNRSLDERGPLAGSRPRESGNWAVSGGLVGKHKRYLIHVAGHNLGLLMPLMIGAGTPKEIIARGNEVGLLVPLANGSVLLLLAGIAGN